MIKKLKFKFVILAGSMILILMILIVSCMNIVNYSSVISEANQTLNALSGLKRSFDDGDFEPPLKPENENGGFITDSSANGALIVTSDAIPGGQGNPQGENPGGQINPQEGNPGGQINPQEGNPGGQGNPQGENPGGQGNLQEENPVPGSDQNEKGNEDFKDFMDNLERRELKDKIGGRMNIEVAYESRFFSVTLDNNGNITNSDLSMTATVGTDELNSYVEKAVKKNKDTGFIGSYRYMRNDTENGSTYIFLDCGRKLDTFYRFLLFSSLSGLAGFIGAFILFILISGKIVKPISESYEKQKMFITDAGHEIKTPLTIISANVELIKSGAGDDECLNDISSQTERLKTLTNDLVSLAHMEEIRPEKNVQLEFPASETVRDIASSFKKSAEFGGKTLNITVSPMIELKGNPAQLERLVSILMDNAVKYTPANGAISLTFEKKGKNVCLNVLNTVERELSQNELARLFDRFYRTDKSRSSATGGHGIGLAIAKAIVESFNGKITAQMSDNNCFAINVIIPS